MKKNLQSLFNSHKKMKGIKRNLEPEYIKTPNFKRETISFPQKRGYNDKRNKENYPQGGKVKADHMISKAFFNQISTENHRSRRDSSRFTREGLKMLLRSIERNLIDYRMIAGNLEKGAVNISKGNLVMPIGLICYLDYNFRSEIEKLQDFEDEFLTMFGDWITGIRNNIVKKKDGLDQIIFKSQDIVENNISSLMVTTSPTSLTFAKELRTQTNDLIEFSYPQDDQLHQHIQEIKANNRIIEQESIQLKNSEVSIPRIHSRLDESRLKIYGILDAIISCSSHTHSLYLLGYKTFVGNGSGKKGNTCRPSTNHGLRDSNVFNPRVNESKDSNNFQKKKNKLRQLLSKIKEDREKRRSHCQGTIRESFSSRSTLPMRKSKISRSQTLFEDALAAKKGKNNENDQNQGNIMYDSQTQFEVQNLKRLHRRAASAVNIHQIQLSRYNHKLRVPNSPDLDFSKTIFLNEN